MIILIKKMLNPNLDLLTKKNIETRITMFDVENELIKLKEMSKSGVWVKEPIRLIRHKPNIAVAPRSVVNFNKLIPSVASPVAQTAGYHSVNTHGKTIKKGTRNRYFKPYTTPILVSNNPELRKEIISKRQQERKTRRIQEEKYEE